MERAQAALQEDVKARSKAVAKKGKTVAKKKAAYSDDDSESDVMVRSPASDAELPLDIRTGLQAGQSESKGCAESCRRS